MGALKSLLCTSLLWWMPVQSYNTNRYICETPASEDVCHYLENPKLMHIIQTRYGGSESVRLPTRVLVEDMPLASRHGMYFDEQQPENIMKHINFGYLNLNQPISSMRDLIDMESDEIGSHYIPKPKPTAVTPWKMDDVKTLLAAPKVLPDIMMNQEEEELPSEIPQNHQFLDEDEIRLGRFVVNDTPPKIPDIIQTEDSELTQETHDISHSEIGERHLSDPARYRSKAHTMVIDKVVPRKEKEQDFMEELYKIKLALALAHEEAEALNQAEAEALKQAEALALAHEEAPEEVLPIPGSGNVRPQHTLPHDFIVDPTVDQSHTVPKAIAVLPEYGVPEAVISEADVPEPIVPEAAVPEVAAPEAVDSEAVDSEAVDSEAEDSEAVDSEGVVPEIVVPEAKKHVPEQKDTENLSKAVHEEPATPVQSNGEDQTFPDHSDNVIEKERKMERVIGNKHAGKTSTLDLKAKRYRKKLAHHIATEAPADESLFVGDSPKVIVVEEDFVTDNDGGDLSPKKKKKHQKSSKNQKSSKVEAETENIYFLPATKADEIPTGATGTEANRDDLNVTKKRKKSNKSSKKKTPKTELVPEVESTIEENPELRIENDKNQKSLKWKELPESSETLSSTETSIEKPSVNAKDTETPQNEKISARLSANHQDSLLDGLLRVL